MNNNACNVDLIKTRESIISQFRKTEKNNLQRNNFKIAVKAFFFNIKLNKILNLCRLEHMLNS